MAEDTLTEQQRLKELLNIAHRPPVEFMGMPCSGKTSIMKRIADEAKERYGKGGVGIIDEKVNQIPYSKREYPFYAHDLSSMLSTSALLGELMGALSKDKGVLLLDRGPHDRAVFTAALAQRGHLDINVGKILYEHYGHYRSCVPLVFLFLVSPETAMLREEERSGIIDPEASIMNPQMLILLLAEYATYAAKHIQKYTPKSEGTGFFLINGEADEEVVYREVAENLFPRVDQLHTISHFNIKSRPT